MEFLLQEGGVLSMNQRQKKKIFKRKLEQIKKENFQKRSIFYSREAYKLYAQKIPQKDIKNYLQFLQEELQLNFE